MLFPPTKEERRSNKSGVLEWETTHTYLWWGCKLEQPFQKEIGYIQEPMPPASKKKKNAYVLI